MKNILLLIFFILLIIFVYIVYIIFICEQRGRTFVLFLAKHLIAILIIMI